MTVSSHRSAESLPALSKLDLNGNQIGEDACEEIKGLFDADDLLGSFSDDEGSDVDDDDDGDGEDEEEDEDEEDESDEADSSVNDSKATNDESNLSIQEVEPEVVTPENVSVSDVFVCPTKAKLFALDGGGTDSGFEILKVNHRFSLFLIFTSLTSFINSVYSSLRMSV